MQQQNQALARYYNKKKKLKKRRKIAFYTLFVVLLICTVTILSLTVFFNIDSIAVNGNNHYTAQKIIDESGLKVGDNLFRLNKFKIIDNLKAKMPYLDTVEIDRKLPVSIEINVTESQDYMCILSGNDVLVVDKNLKILNRTDEAVEGLATVYGVVPLTDKIGQVVTSENGADATLLQLSGVLYDVFGADKITSIDVSAAYDVRVRYEDRLDIEFGTLENIDEKVRLVEYVINENSKNEHAQIGFSSGNRVYYRAND